MKSWIKNNPGVILVAFMAVCCVLLSFCAATQAHATERTLPAGTTAYTEIIEVGDSTPVVVPSIWSIATVMVRQIDGGNASFRAAIGTSTVDARLPLIKNINASFRSAGFMALQSETGTATLVIYRIAQSERALALDEGELTVSLPSADVAAELATDSIGLVAAIDAVTAEVAQPTEKQQQIVSLTANTAADITSEIVGRRDEIWIRAQDPEKQYWISTEGTAVIGAAIPVRDWIKIRLPKDVTISAISSEALDLSVFESGW